ncbi:hypothetical protein N8476_00850 [Akkermansiaceae bacterium]|nr:hypothetical protein [Akkermansiaceae bacterium]
MGGSAFCELLIPEPFTLNRETGAKEEGSKIEGTGYGLQRGGSSSSPVKVLFLRVEGYNLNN